MITYILLLFLILSTLSNDSQQETQLITQTRRNLVNPNCVFYVTIHNNCSEYNITDNEYNIWRKCWHKCWKKYHKRKHKKKYQKKCWKKCKNNILGYYNFLNVSHIDFEYLNYSFPLEYACDTLYPILYNKCNEISQHCNYNNLLQNITNWCIFDTKIDQCNYDILLKKISDILKTNVSLECNYMNLLTNLTKWLSENKVKEQKCNCTEPSLLKLEGTVYNGQSVWANIGNVSGVTVSVILVCINSIILCSILRKIGNIRIKIPQLHNNEGRASLIPANDTNNLDDGPNNVPIDESNNEQDHELVTILIDKSNNNEVNNEQNNVSENESDDGSDDELDEESYGLQINEELINDQQNNESNDEQDNESDDESDDEIDIELDEVQITEELENKYLMSIKIMKNIITDQVNYMMELEELGNKLINDQQNDEQTNGVDDELDQAVYSNSNIVSGKETDSDSNNEVVDESNDNE